MVSKTICAIIPTMLNLFTQIWRPVEKGLKLVGKVQSTILLSVAYILLGIIAVPMQIIKLFANKPNKRTYWVVRTKEMDTEITLRRQF